MIENPLVIYHNNCSDGITAAWVVTLKYLDAELFGADFGVDPPDTTNRDVIIVDFSYKRDTIKEMYNKAKSLIVLDHHKTAEEELKGLPYCIFDMKKSGAGLAWDYFFPGKKRHMIVNYIEDKDLWSWTLTNSREVNLALNTPTLTIERLNQLNEYYGKSNSYEHVFLHDMETKGKVLLEQSQTYILRVAKSAYLIKLDNYNVLAVNSSLFQSELGNYLAKDRPFAVVWMWNGENYIVSLRGKEESNVDVSKIAKKYGGGGHKLAAGFGLRKEEGYLLL